MVILPVLILFQKEDKKNLIYLIIFTSIPFLTLTLFPTIKSCCIADELNQINNEIWISSAVKLNKTFIIISFLMYGIILIIIAALFIPYIIEKCSLNKLKNNESKDVTKTAINNVTSNSN